RHVRHGATQRPFRCAGKRPTPGRGTQQDRASQPAFRCLRAQRAEPVRAADARQLRQVAQRGRARLRLHHHRYPPGIGGDGRCAGRVTGRHLPAGRPLRVEYRRADRGSQAAFGAERRVAQGCHPQRSQAQGLQQRLRNRRLWLLQLLSESLTQSEGNAVFRTVSMMQPYLFPYLGYFQLIACSDAFVLGDDLQYVKASWINRNRILVGGEPKWLTFPLRKGEQQDSINQRWLCDDAPKEFQRLLRTLELAYARAPHFERTMAMIRQILANPERNLAKFTEYEIGRAHV